MISLPLLLESLAAMPDIRQDLPVQAPTARVFDAVSSPAGLDAWWSLDSDGGVETGAVYRLGFGPGFEWRAEVTVCDPPRAFELRFLEADDDWTGTRVGFALEPRGDGTWVRFHHSGWPVDNEHFRTSCHCWALYLRLMRRYVERGDVVDYRRRLDA